ncbi:hypothetical protein [Amycolatopsis lurida]|uniref:hypothetical protein n=1 Tax=Amycolatopsis lurida TaxID=31959 RepID=UPI003658C416
MSSEFNIISGGEASPNTPLWPGQRREQRELQRRASAAVSEAVASANVKVLQAELRKRFTEKSMFDVADVMGLFKQLTGADPTVAAALAPIVEEYVRGTARDVRNFDGLFGGL